MLRAMAILFLAAGSAAPEPVQGPVSDQNAPAALASFVSGEVSVTRPGARRPVRRFDWLSPGSRIELGAASRLTLAFATGNRYELGPGPSAATIVPGGLGEVSGSVVALPSVPPLPRIQVAAPGRADRAMAVRIRGSRIAGLYPDDASVLADDALLRFSPVPGAGAYRVEIETDDGDSVFRVETQATTLHVTSGVLKRDRRYRWSVRTVGPSSADPGLLARGEAEFTTLSSDNEQARARLREALAGADPASLALLAEIDRGLGLRWEAREGFREALATAPGDPEVSAALNAVQELIGQ